VVIMLDIFFFRKSVLHRKTTNATKALAQIVSDAPALLIVTSCQRSATNFTGPPM
jgi:hypothetical protein